MTGIRVLAATSTAVILTVTAFLVPAVASAEEPPDDLDQMGEYDPADYTEEAAALPEGMVEAVERDLGVSAEVYLAEADAAIQAVQVVESLQEAGVEVLASAMEGSTLVVNVPDESAVPVVESTGAVAEIGEPVAEPDPEPAPELDLQTAAADLYGGQGYVWQDSTHIYQCSIGFNGYLTSNGSQQAVTAGHCFEGSNAMQGQIRLVNPASNPGLVTSESQVGAQIGLPTSGTIEFGNARDAARITLNGSTSGKASVGTYGGASSPLLTGGTRVVTGYTLPIDGASMCRSGSRSGWRCGVIDRANNQPAIDQVETINGHTVNSVWTTACALPGDSGGPAMIGTSAFGVLSWIGVIGPNSPTQCSQVGASGYFPMVSANNPANPNGQSILSFYGSTWEPAVTVSTPVVSTPNPATFVPNATQISGTIANASAQTRVLLFLDGATNPTAEITPTLPSGSWTYSLAALPNGLHSYRVIGKWGGWSLSGEARGIFGKNFSVQRYAGGDRFETNRLAVAANYDPGVPVLYVATGYNYPDALSAGPAASHLGAPLVLVAPDSIPAQTAQLIEDLEPDRIVVLGGTAGISESVLNQLVQIQPNTDRIGGASRYETSLLVTRDAFLQDSDPGGATHVIITDGRNFPDALSAGPAAASVDGAVVLVPGGDNAVNSATLDLLDDLGVTTISIAGGTAAVSQGIQNQLLGEGYSVTRYAGSGRFETSHLINDGFFNPIESVALLATGYNYPDALTGAALGGKLGAPLYTTPTNCVWGQSLDDLVSFQTSTVLLLGGTASLDANVAAMRRC